MTAIVLPHGRIVSSTAGTKRSTRVPGTNTDAKSKSAGSTPAIVTGSSLIVTAWPTIEGSAANRRCHTPWVRITARGPLRTSSSGVKSRPAAG